MPRAARSTSHVLRCLIGSRGIALDQNPDTDDRIIGPPINTTTATSVLNQSSKTLDTVSPLSKGSYYHAISEELTPTLDAPAHTPEENQNKSESFQIQSQKRQEAALRGVENVQNKMQELASLSTEQFSTIIGLLQEIQPTPVQMDARDKPTAKEATGMKASDEISESITRISRLAAKKGTSVHSDEAQSIITDLETILMVVSDGAIQRNERKRRRTDDLPETEIKSHDIKRMRGMLIAASSIAFDTIGLYI